MKAHLNVNSHTSILIYRAKNVRFKSINLGGYMKMSNNTQMANLYSLIQESRSIPSKFITEFESTDTKARLTLRLNSAVSEAIRSSAEYNRMSVNEYIIQAIFEKLSCDMYLKKLEADLDDFSLLKAEKDALPGNETLLDKAKFNESRMTYKDKTNATRASKYRIMRTCS